MRIASFKSALLLALITVLLLALAVSFLPANQASALPNGLVPHDPIYIVGNDDFTPANGITSGSGMLGNPYIIENLDIIAENAHGIRIENTTAYFIIRNCYMHDGKDNGRGGIWFENVINGEIDNVTSNNNFHGIFVGISSNNIILNCIVRNNDYGIILGASVNNTVENCIVSNNRRGITASGSNNIILKCAIENNELGIFFATLLFEDDDHLHKSTSNTVRNCAILNNTYGIRFSDDSKNNHIYHNNFKNNGESICFYFPAKNNYIHHNNFINNPSQAFDNSSNYWDNDYPSGGNYWSDYPGVDADGNGIGDTPYSISGGNNQDRYPLMKPFDEVPSDERNWPLIAGIVGVIAIIGVVAFYARKR